MSCVVSIVKNGKIYMGADGFATTGDGEKRSIVANKLYFNREYLIGYTGSVRTGQIIGPKFFDPPGNVYEMPDAIRVHLLERGAGIINGENQMHLNACNFLIGYNGRLFEILIDYQLNEIRGDFTAVGSGAPYAMGSLFATKRWNSPEKRVLNSLKAASEYDRSCGLPFTVEVMK